MHSYWFTRPCEFPACTEEEDDDEEEKEEKTISLQRCMCTLSILVTGAIYIHKFKCCTWLIVPALHRESIRASVDAGCYGDAHKQKNFQTLRMRGSEHSQALG